MECVEPAFETRDYSTRAVSPGLAGRLRIHRDLLLDVCQGLDRRQVLRSSLECLFQFAAGRIELAETGERTAEGDAR
jgi:hypothetical protein